VGYGSSVPLSALTEAVLSLGSDAAAVADLLADTPAGPAARRLANLLTPRPALSEPVLQDRHDFAAAVVELLTALALDRPLVVFLEDVHEAGTDLRQALARLRSERPAAPILLVVTSRAESEADRRVELGPLGRDEVAQIVSAHLGRDPAPVVVDRLHQRTVGNPLWLKETLALDTQGNGLVGSDVPGTLRLVIAARVDAVAPDDKRVLQRVSVAEQSCPPAWLLEGRPAESARPLVAAGLLQVSEQGLLSFRHDLVRDVVYASVPRAERVLLHSECRGIARDHAARTHHGVQAWRLSMPQDPERPARARDAGCDLARLAASLASVSAQAAVDAFDRARDVVAALEEDDAGQAVELCRLEAQALLELEQREQALLLATRAVDLASGCGDLLAAWAAQLTVAAVQFARGEVALAQRLAQEVLDTPELPVAWQARAYALLARTQAYEPSLGMTAFRRAHELYLEAGDSAGAADGARQIAWLLSVHPTRDYQPWIERAAALTPSQDVRGQASLSRTRAMAAGVRFEWQECAEQSTLAWRDARRLGSVHLQVWMLTKLAEAQLELGCFDELSQTCAELGRLTVGGRRSHELAGLAAQLQLLVRTGEVAASRRVRAQLGALLSALGPGERAYIDGVDGLLAVDRGDWAAALSPLVDAEQQADELGWTLHAAQTRVGRLTALYRLGDPDAVPQLLELAAFYDDEDVPAGARLARAIAGQPSPGPAMTLAEAAWVAEHEALARPSSSSWERAATAWERLGLTEHLALALTRAGRGQDAERVRALLGA
jgi:hypothetical protein